MDDPVGMCTGSMIGRVGVAVAGYQGTEGVEPGMKFHIALMTFADHKFQRVIFRKRRLALFTGKIFTPGFVGRREKGIGGRPYLYHYCIKAAALEEVQVVDKFLLLLLGRQTLFGGPVDIAYRCNPGSP